MKENLTLEDFPVRPRINVGESLSGYCWRIYVENGHELCSQVRMALKDVHFGAEAEHVLAQFLGADIFAKIRATQRVAVERWNTYTGPKWFALAKTPRICPTCIGENGFHALLWDHPLMKACGIHGTLLIQRCHACGAVLNWRTLLRGWICGCGAHVHRAPVVPASKEWIELARLVASASDAQVPGAINGNAVREMFGVASYRTRDLYEMLWWLLRMRQALTEHAPRARHVAGKIASQQGARVVPGAWEIRLLEFQHGAVVVKVRRALRWFFKDDQWMLVDHDSVASIQRFHDVVNALGRSKNAVAAALHNTVAQTLTEYSAHIDEANRICFHPRLDVAERRGNLHAFLTWWPTFASEVPLLKPADELCRQVDEKTQFYTEEDGDFPAGLMLLNILFAVANKQYPSVALASVQSRWHLPSELRQPLDRLSDLGLYLLYLHRRELAFVMILIADAMDRWTQTHPDLS